MVIIITSIIGKVLLTKRKIMLDIQSQRCTSCLDNDCLHFQAFEQCLGYNTIFICEASHLDDIITAF